MKLKNGTDVRGTAIAGQEPVTLTDEAVAQIAKAFFVWVTRRTSRPPVIAVGYDSRLSSPHIARVCAEAICACGGSVLITGLSSTPSMFMLLKDDFGADASVMITASHLPYRKNGMKFFVPDGGLEGDELKEVLVLAAENSFPVGRGSIAEKPYLDRYAEQLVRTVRDACNETYPLAGRHILVDAGNGAGGFYAERVLKPLGANTEGSQFLEPDGNFPNHIPNPENEDAMKSVCRAVLENHADFGIIFDTDVDRAGAVSRTGEEINRNRLIALISAILLEENAGGCIVTDSVTSDDLSRFIRDRGGVHRRFKRGYKNVINECKRLNAEGINSPLAIETSGHAAFRENDYLDDGAYLVTKLLISLSRLAKQGRELTDLIDDLSEPKQALEVRLKIHSPDFRALGERAIAELTKAFERLPYCTLAPDNFEGVRVNFDKAHGDGWTLIRMSLHEPILPVNAESERADGATQMLNTVYELLKDYPQIEREGLLRSMKK